MMSDIDDALDALETLESQPLVGGHGETRYMRELYPTAFAKVRAALERQRLPEWVGTDGIITERLRQITEFEGEASIPKVLEEMEKLRRAREGFRQALERHRELIEALEESQSWFLAMQYEAKHNALDDLIYRNCILLSRFASDSVPEDEDE